MCTDDLTPVYKRFTPEQTQYLEAEFAANMYPSRTTILYYATQLGVNGKKIMNWFVRKRMELRGIETKGNHYNATLACFFYLYAQVHTS